MRMAQTGGLALLYATRLNTERLDDLCQILFDRWCERRALVPLCYLLIAWPFAWGTAADLHRLSDALGELLRDNKNDLSSYELSVIRRIMSEITCVCIEDVMSTPERPWNRHLKAAEDGVPIGCLHPSKGDER
jgi:hypothetical protein